MKHPLRDVEPNQTRELCPFLPHEFSLDLCADHIHQLGKDRSVRFYRTALQYAQKLWVTGFPAQSLLLINRALSCRLDTVSLHDPTFASPYLAVSWILKHRDLGGFIGNPRRHYQHLATRMVEPYKTLRTWRAWACWYMAKVLLPAQDYPPDVKQIWKEHLIEPTKQQIIDHLSALSPNDDLPAWEEALKHLPIVTQAKSLTSLQFHEITDSSDLKWVSKLAHIIWPKCYSDILSSEQISYMLKIQYEQSYLTALSQQPDYHFILTTNQENSDPFGFLAYEVLRDHSTSFLHKIYVRKEWRNSGIGSRILNKVEELSKQAGCQSLRLRVNKFNYDAITAYTRAGFRIDQEMVTDIGENFIMDDYELVKPLL